MRDRGGWYVYSVHTHMHSTSIFVYAFMYINVLKFMYVLFILQSVISNRKMVTAETISDNEGASHQNLRIPVSGSCHL